MMSHYVRQPFADAVSLKIYSHPEHTVALLKCSWLLFLDIDEDVLLEEPPAPDTGSV